MGFTRITVGPRQMGGVPCIRGLRMPVATVVGMVADGMTVDETLKEHPTLEAEDIREALQYAAEAVRERMIPLEALTSSSITRCHPGGCGTPRCRMTRCTFSTTECMLPRTKPSSSAPHSDPARSSQPTPTSVLCRPCAGNFAFRDPVPSRLTRTC
jgi:uncharacterized protein (DUF433 family)